MGKYILSVVYFWPKTDFRFFYFRYQQSRFKKIRKQTCYYKTSNEKKINKSLRINNHSNKDLSSPKIFKISQNISISNSKIRSTAAQKTDKRSSLHFRFDLYSGSPKRAKELVPFYTCALYL